MDRRQQKTRKAIFRAFRTLLETRRYDHITVQDIIDEADVGRSTFYAHFETKDLLLDALCGDMFYHLFENDPCPFEGKDNDLKAQLTHVLWHIRQDRQDISGLLLSDSSDLFLGYFKEHLRVMFDQHMALFPSDIPRDFLSDHLVGSFSETVRWWLKENMVTSPETTAQYFMNMLHTT